MLPDTRRVHNNASGLRAGRARSASEDAIGPEAAKAPEAPLVKHTKFHSVFRELIDEKTGEIQRVTRDTRTGELRPILSEEDAIDEGRSVRFALQRTAKRVLHDSQTPTKTVWRVTGCTWRRVAAEVGIHYAPSVGRSHYSGLMVCGSVWTCPVCASKISERRRQEIEAVSYAHESAGGEMVMLTLTFPHSREDRLSDLLERFRDALTRFRKTRKYSALKAAAGYVGHIRGLEVTHGASGWHPHSHELWLVSGHLTGKALERLQSQLFKLWQKAAVSAGFKEPSPRHGLKITRAESAQTYLIKTGLIKRWNQSHELTKSHTKKGRKASSRTPWDILRTAESFESDALLFREYASAFFGARQLVWSRGLKALFDIEDKSDEELASEQVEEAELVSRISAERWRLILRQPRDVRALVLRLSETGGATAVDAYLGGLQSSFEPPPGAP